MMNRRRADGARAVTIVGSPRLSTLTRSGGVVLSLGAVLSACTLTNDTFEPVLVSTPDAGALDPIDDSSAPLDDVAPSAGCSSEGAPGIGLNGDGTACPGSIGLIPGNDSTQADAAGDAGPIFEPNPSLSLPPCEGTFGPFGDAEPLVGLDFDENVFGPVLSADGRRLYFSAYASGEQQIYTATRDERGARFGDVRELSGVNSAASDGSPFISADGERLYLFSDREGGAGGRDVWLSERPDRSTRFSEPRPLAGINSPATELLPWLADDELSVIFVSDRQGGRGGADLWMATRDAIDDDFSSPFNLGGLSSGENEGRAVLSADGLTVFFSSDRSGGRGGPDLWVATREQRDQPFSAPRNLFGLNSPANDQDVALSSDGTELFFASSRAGASALWRAQRACE
ncbi:MAG TPA: hypothetical protein VMG12_12635 [Polyangiaceae bacterium]|nr:hypothetical protein [Polyangiaceae bacterium]